MLSIITPTHNTQHLRATYKSLQQQSTAAWEWVVVLNGEAKKTGFDMVVSDPRVRVIHLPEELEGKGIGAIKKFAFGQGKGEYLAELDHDDLLLGRAVYDITSIATMLHPDFIYSNCCDFFPKGEGHWFPNWKENGWRYRNYQGALGDATHTFNECRSFEPSAAALSLIYYAPNHIRVWKKEFYERIGGHNAEYTLADDHELLIRTYLNGSMFHIDRPLYLYRMGDQNTFSKNLSTIRSTTWMLYSKYVEQLILRESLLTETPCYDLGGGIDGAPGWTTVDIRGAQINANLNEKWPFADGSVLAFRCHDIIEHLADKQHTMRELHRCLKPGGWALISVPSTDGRGAFCDPTHVSYWNESSFWYYTRPASAKYIHNTACHFMESRLFTYMPSTWHQQHNLWYTKAELRKHDGNMIGIPGFSNFPR